MNSFYKKAFKRFLTFLLALSLIVGMAPSITFVNNVTALPTDLYGQLLACTDAASMLDLITDNAGDAAALSSEKLATLTQTAESFPLSDERTELLETLNVLSGSDTSENSNTLAAAAEGITVGVYDKEPSSASANLLTTLVSADSGLTADAGDWAYTESRFFQIQVNGIPTGTNYELVITMQPILKVLSLPDPTGTSGYTYTPNKLKANTNRVYSAEYYDGYSGTIVYTLAADTTALAFALEVGYSLTVWNKLTGLLNYDTSTPLFSVYLREVGSEEKMNQQNLHQANSSVAWPERRDIHLGDLFTNVASAYKDSAVLLGWTRMVNDSYNDHFYYHKISFEIDIPSYTHTDGNTYYLDCNTDGLTLIPSDGTAECSIVTDEENHKVIITVCNYYTRRNSHFDNIEFSLPADVATAIDGEDACRFSGSFRVLQYPSADATEGTELSLNNGNAFHIDYSTRLNSQLVLGGRSMTTSTHTPGAVKVLGQFALGNNGTGDSGPIRVHIEFDSSNTNNLYVTTFNLMPDFVTEYIAVEYTLVDREGNTKSGTYSLKNPYYNSPPESDSAMNVIHVRFTRNMLIEEGEDYYLKTVEYSLASLPAKTRIYSTGGHKGEACGGVFWGYVNENAPDGATVTHTITLSSINGDGTETPLEGMKKTPKTTLTSNNASSYILNSASVDGSSAVKEIAAGDTVKISGQFLVTAYPFGNTGAVSKVRLGLMLPQGITFTADDVFTSIRGVGSYEDIVVNAPTAENPLWVIELNDDILLGGFTEDIGAFDNGNRDRASFSIYLHTEKSMQGQTLLLKNIFWAAAEGQSDMLIGGSYQSQAAADPYNLNGYEGADDYIASFPNNATAGFTIVAAPVQLDISASIRDSSETAGDLNAATKHFADYVTYDLQIHCNDGGTTEDFSYLIPIPKTDSPIDAEFVATRNVDFELRSEPKVTMTSGTPLKLLYTIAPAATLTYDYASTEDIWLEAGEITDWTAVTMIKVMSDEPIQTGTLAVISALLYYADTVESYAQNAGQTVQFSSRGYYRHRKGSQLFAGVASTDVATASLEYTVPEVQKITLVAAKDRDPKNDVDPWVTLNLDTQFVLAQNFSVHSVDLNNVNLVPSNSDFTSLNSNTDFGITVCVNSQTSKDLSADISSGNTLALGTVASQNAISFKFEIFNGNALSDTITPRTVNLSIVGHNGVTIPVEITIRLEAAAVENATVSILPYREYLPFDSGTSVVISQGCTITAQFVVSGLIPDNYPTRTLSFDVAPTANTQILMIDWTDSASPQYYYYNLNGTTSSVPLANFVSLASGQEYLDPTGTTEIPNETLLFIVVFPNAQENSREITLTHTAVAGVETVSDSLTYSFTGTHGFTLTVPASTVTAGESFNVSYSNTAPPNADSRYANKKLALVVTSASGRLPVNARLMVDGTAYHLNANGQFIIPLGPLSTSGTVSASKSMTFLSETQTGEITLQAQLYVSATANDAQPMAGEALLSRTFTVKPKTLPAFRIVQMSNRLFVLGEDTLAATLSYAFMNLTDCNVTLEVQKKSGNGYATDGYYLNTLNGVSATTVQLDVTTLINSGNPLNMVFNDLPAGTYRILFTITRDGSDPISIPYNFLVIEQ